MALRNTAAVLASLLAGASSSANFHVSALGDDSRTPTEAGSPATPWRSFAPLADVVLRPGDSILLQRGDTIRSTLRIARSGTGVAPIVVAPYGTGSTRPVVAGSDRPSSWTATASDVWTAKPGVAEVARVLLSGGAAPNARWPDTGWVVSTAFEGDSTVTAPTGARDWVGASILLRTAHWTLEVHEVVAQNGDRLSLSGGFRNLPKPGVRLFLTNHPSAFAQRNRWAFSAKDSTLRWFGDDPRTLPIEVAVRPRGIDLAGASHVRIRGIEVLGAGREAIRIQGDGVLVEDCRLVHPGLVGVLVLGKSATVRRTEIVGAGNGAVVSYGSRTRVEESRASRTALLGDLGPLGMGTGCCGGRAIDITGDSLVVRRNRLDSTGYIGVGFRGLGALVEENTIDRSCMTTDDCGGIYTYVGNYDSAGSAGSVIRRNIVRDGVGAPGGVEDAWAAAHGIYLDDGSHDIRVDSNVSIGNDRGIFLHNTRRALVRGNLVAGSRAVPIGLSHDGLAGTGDMFDNILEGNILVAGLGEQAQPSMDVHQPQSLPLGSLRGNIVCRDRLVSMECAEDGAILWSAPRVDSLDRRLGPEQMRNRGFDSARIGWSSWPSFVRLSVDSSAACDRGKCLRIEYRGDTTVRNGLVNTGRDIPTVQGDVWLLRFRARGGRPNQSLDIVYRRGWDDYAPLGLSTGIGLDTVWRTFEFAFRAEATDARTRVDFHASQSDSVWWLDDASLRLVPREVLPADSAFRILVASDSLPRSTPLEPDAWRFWNGDAAGSAVALEGYSGVALFRGPPSESVFPRVDPARTGVVRRSDGVLVFTGLRGPVAIRDASGRLRARIAPGPSGEATWNPQGTRGLVVVDDGSRARLVLLAR